MGMIMNVKELKEVAAMSAGLKALCTILALEGMEQCRRCCGGNGYLLNSGIAQMTLDFTWQITAEGDYMILSLLTSKFLLKSAQKVASGVKLEGIMSYLNVLNDTNILLKDCRPKSAKKPSEFFDIDYLCELFKYRALISIQTSFKNFQERLMSGKTLDEVSNESAHELYEASRAHSFLLLMLNFREFINTTNKAQSDLECLKVLKRLCALFGNCNIVDDNWGGVLENSQFEMVKEAINVLLVQIRPDAVSIVDSFDIPDNVLNSTIGKFDGNVYEALVEAANKSEMNKVDPFEGYEDSLRPHLDLEFLKKRNKWEEKPQKL